MEEQGRQEKIDRRKFVGNTLWGTFLLTVGGTAGWLGTRDKDGKAVAKPKTAKAPAPINTYDLSKYEKVDPKHLKYRQVSEFDTTMKRVQRLAVTNDNRVFVANEDSVTLFELDGQAINSFKVPGPVHCIYPLDEQRLIVGTKDRFAIVDMNGGVLEQSPEYGSMSFLTSITCANDHLFIADAGNREVMKCTMSGDIVTYFGRKNKALDNPGFTVPSPYFDLAIADNGKLRIVNPGELRVETYDQSGAFESSWGGPGMSIDRFCGCCNPVYITLLRDGRIVTSEKGLTRINVYTANGDFEATVAGPNHLVKDKILARKACRDCKIGFGFDVATDHQDRILALDPYTERVRIYERLEAKA